MWSIHVAMGKSYIGFSKMMMCIHNMQCNKHMQSIFIATLLFKPIRLAQSILYSHAAVCCSMHWDIVKVKKLLRHRIHYVSLIQTPIMMIQVHVHACTLEVEMTNVLSAIASSSISSSSSSIPAAAAAEYIVKVLA